MSLSSHTCLSALSKCRVSKTHHLWRLFCTFITRLFIYIHIYIYICKYMISFLFPRFRPSWSMRSPTRIGFVLYCNSVTYSLRYTSSPPVLSVFFFKFLFFSSFVAFGCGRSVLSWRPGTDLLASSMPWPLSSTCQHFFFLPRLRSCFPLLDPSFFLLVYICLHPQSVGFVSFCTTFFFFFPFFFFALSLYFLLGILNLLPFLLFFSHSTCELFFPSVVWRVSASVGLSSARS